MLSDRMTFSSLDNFYLVPYLSTFMGLINDWQYFFYLSVATITHYRFYHLYVRSHPFTTRNRQKCNRKTTAESLTVFFPECRQPPREKWLLKVSKSFLPIRIGKKLKNSKNLRALAGSHTFLIKLRSLFFSDRSSIFIGNISQLHSHRNSFLQGVSKFASTISLSKSARKK